MSCRPGITQGLCAILRIQFSLKDCRFLYAETCQTNASQETVVLTEAGTLSTAIPKLCVCTLLVGNLFAQYICHPLSYPHELYVSSLNGSNLFFVQLSVTDTSSPLLSDYVYMPLKSFYDQKKIICIYKSY